MNKKDIENLDKWSWDMDREYDNIYVVPTRKTMDGYKMAYYIGRIGEEYKIIDLYDCGTLWLEATDKYFMLHWDFEDIYGGIKFWRNGKKLKYEYGGRITI